MADLADYNARRNFMRTPEPFGAVGRSDPDHLRFVIQQHFSARAHFDLRLEWKGVLMSWAVPEGPSIRTKDRRLAVRTEDHPLDYADFAGVIPEGEYGAGEMTVWDQGIWVPVTEPVEEALAAGELKFRLAGQKLRGGWTLVKLPKGEKDWLWIKERDAGAGTSDIQQDAPDPVLRPKRRTRPGKRAPMPNMVKPMLATAQPAPPEGDDWLHELKYDGYRTLLWQDGDTVRATTRNGHDWTGKYGSIVDAASRLDCKTAIVDGEIVVQDARGASSFAMLQRALADSDDASLIFYGFDLLYLDGRDLTGAPLHARKELLRRLIPVDPSSRLQFSDHSVGNGRAFFAQACRLGLEGIVSKRRDTPYRQSRSTNWIKAKRYDVGRFAVVGFTTKASARHVASLMLAEEGTLAYLGRASSGLSNEWAAKLFDSLGARATEKSPVDAPLPSGGTWIAPGQVVAEVTFRGRTDSGALRQPSLLAVRETTPAGAQPVRRRRLMTDRDLAAVQLTNPDREVFKGSGTTKLDIALYYARVGDVMLPHILHRPVTLIRCTTGKLEDCFYQRHAMLGLPEGVEAIKDTRSKEFLVIRNARGLLGLTQFGAIEFHPWDCRADRLDRPDRFTVDLDPDEALPWSAVASAAFDIRDRLTSVGLSPFVRTTGGKGLHIVVPLERRQGWVEVRAYLRALAQALAADAPRQFVTTSQKAARKGRIFIDMGRTQRGSSATASYSLRARPDFPAAVPLNWTELQHFTNRPIFDRKSAVFRVEQTIGDPWEDLNAAHATISSAARRDVGLKD